MDENRFPSDDIPLYDDQRLVEKANAGLAPALYALGLRFFRGDGVALDRRQGLRLIRSAADRGNGAAQRDLGYQSGFNEEAIPEYAKGWEDEWNWLVRGTAVGANGKAPKPMV
jgi:TPR repeat protein